MTVVVLAFPFRYAGYSQDLIRDAAGWIRHFRSAEAAIVCVLPQEHSQESRHFVPEFRDDRLVVLSVPSFETCDRWRAGLSYAAETYSTDEAPYFHLWSADFGFDGPDGPSLRAASSLLSYSGSEDLVVGSFESSGTKELLESVATRPLLANWFPEEAQQLLKLGISKPRSELFRISRALLDRSLERRWFPSEQTIHLALQCLWNWEDCSLAGLPLGHIQDDDSNRVSRNVVEQVDRMELWLSYMWREHTADWDARTYVSKREAGFQIVRSAYDALLGL